MIVEVALIIVILIIVVSEFVKYNISPYYKRLSIHRDCKKSRESFEENNLFKKRINESHRPKQSHRHMLF